MTFIGKSIVLTCAFGGSIGPLQADWRDETGYTRLKLLVSAELPAPPIQGFSQIEAPVAVSTFIPDTASSLFAGKTFNNKSGLSSISSHATHVATNFYGNSTSLLTGNCPVDLYEADSWLGSAFLKLGTYSQPAQESREIQNHSWVGFINEGFSETTATEIGRRLDFAINRDGFVSVVGGNNGNSTVLPAILCQSYHTISVGRDDGGHSAGLTTFDGIGRMKPDIVAPSASPEYATSWTTPMVSSAAGLLFAKLAAAPYSLTGADTPRVIKALLLATATKDTLASWSNTPNHPLDSRYGAGELNVHHAYQALRAGRAAASDNTRYHGCGWSAEPVPRNSTKTYFFAIAPGAPATPFCAALTWHRVITDGLLGSFWGGLNVDLANLNLRLYQTNGFIPSSLVAESLSGVDNVELIYQSALAPGNYALVVENTSGTTDTTYALAWHSLPPVTVTATLPSAHELDERPGLITITRGGDTSLPLLVPLTVGGTAHPGSHFQGLPSSITLAAGQASMELSISPVSDALAQGDRTVTVAIAADFTLVRDSSQIATVTLEDKPFDAWRFKNFTASELDAPAVSGENADPDGDGFTNLIEYALALDPKLASSAPITATATDGYLALTATKNPAATDILWAAELTGDLEKWSPAVIIPAALGDFKARDFINTDDATKRFIRLKITRP